MTLVEFSQIQYLSHYLFAPCLLVSVKNKEKSSQDRFAQSM